MESGTYIVLYLIHSVTQIECYVLHVICHGFICSLVSLWTYSMID